MRNTVQGLQNILAELEDPIKRCATQLSDLHDSLKSELGMCRAMCESLIMSQESERRELLTWMSKIPHQSHHKIVGEGILSGSGAWLLQKTEFVEWRKSSASSVLWLHGIRRLRSYLLYLGV
jgi:hypothetical protein